MNRNDTPVDRLFSVSINVIVDILSLLTLGLLVSATAMLGLEFYDALTDWEPGKLRHVAINIFTVLVYIEVIQLFRNFRHGAGVVLRDIIEVSFLLVIREFAILAMEGTLEPLKVLGIAAVLATLSLAWWLVEPRKQ